MISVTEAAEIVKRQQKNSTAVVEELMSERIRSGKFRFSSDGRYIFHVDLGKVDFSSCDIPELKARLGLQGWHAEFTYTDSQRDGQILNCVLRPGC